MFHIPFYCVRSDNNTNDILNEIIEPEKYCISRSDFLFKTRIGSGGFG